MQKLVNTFVILVGDIVQKITEMHCSFSSYPLYLPRLKRDGIKIKHMNTDY